VGAYLKVSRKNMKIGGMGISSRTNKFSILIMIPNPKPDNLVIGKRSKAQYFRVIRADQKFPTFFDFKEEWCGPDFRRLKYLSAVLL
jgi:hypothetical protein